MKVTFLGHGLESQSENAIGNYLVKFLSSTEFDSFTALSAFASRSAIQGLAKYIEKAKKHRFSKRQSKNGLSTPFWASPLPGSCKPMFAGTNCPAQMAGELSIIRFFFWSILIARRWSDSLLASLPYHLMLGPLRVSRRFSFLSDQPSRLEARGYPAHSMGYLGCIA